jgi:hypothetical protein
MVCLQNWIGSPRVASEGLFIATARPAIRPGPICSGTPMGSVPVPPRPAPGSSQPAVCPAPETGEWNP